MDGIAVVFLAGLFCTAILIGAIWISSREHGAW